MGHKSENVPFLLCKELNVLQIECKRPEKMIDLMHENRHSYKRCSNQLPEYKLYPVPDHCWSVSLLQSKVLETLVLTRPNLQCCLIENHQSPFYVVNRVTLTGKNLYQKSQQSSELTICALRRFRSFQKGTIGLCRSTGCKITSC